MFHWSNGTFQRIVTDAQCVPWRQLTRVGKVSAVLRNFSFFYYKYGNLLVHSNNYKRLIVAQLKFNFGLFLSYFNFSLFIFPGTLTFEISAASGCRGCRSGSCS